MVTNMNEEKYNYKASDLKQNNKSRIKSICNEYGLNLGNKRKNYEDVFDASVKLKRFKKD